MKYLDSVWYCSALASEITQTPLARTICELPVVLYRTQTGRVTALEDRCAHRQAPLSLGTVHGEDIECAYHGFTFDCSGNCVHIPHQDIVPKAARVRSFTAVERWGYVWLWMGTAEKANPDLVPDLPWTSDPAFRTVYFRFAVNANFQLMADNLMDVSHTEFLHRSSIGSQTGRKGQQDSTKVELDCRTEGERVHFQRRVRNTALSPIAARWAGSNKPITRTNTLMWEAPNTVHSILTFENEEANAKIHMEHIMTPASENATHYFMNWTRNFGIQNIGYPTDEDVRKEQTAVVCGEDVPMVEAQQKNILKFGEVRDVASSQDRFITSVHRTLSDMYTRAGLPVPIEINRIALRRAS